MPEPLTAQVLPQEPDHDAAVSPAAEAGASPETSSFPPESTSAAAVSPSADVSAALPPGVSEGDVIHTPETLKPLNLVAIQAHKAEQGLPHTLEETMTYAEAEAAKLADKVVHEVHQDLTSLHLHGHVAISDLKVRSVAVGHINDSIALSGGRPSTPKGPFEIVVTGSDRNGPFTKRKVLKSQPGLIELLAVLAFVHTW